MIKLVISLIVLGIINAIVVRLPGIDVSIPGLPITIPTVVTTVIGVMMISMVLRFGYEVSPPIRGTFPSFPELAIIVANLVYLAAVGIAYTSFEGLVHPFLLDTPWVYPLVFLAIAILPVVRVASTLLGSVDKWSAWISGRISRVPGELVTCPECGKKIASDAEFCSSCGAKLAGLKIEAGIRRCPKCGAELEPDATFCNKCGTKIEREPEEEFLFRVKEEGEGRE